jgi:hypothetical protein
VLLLCCGQPVPARPLPDGWRKDKKRSDLHLGIARGRLAPRKRTLEIRFAIKNAGRKPVSVVERMSCAGYVGHAIELTLEPVAPLARRAPILVVAPRRHSCDKNVPILRTIAPGGRLATAVTFQLPARVQPGRYQVVGRNFLEVAGRKERARLRSRPLRVDLRRLAR